MTLTELCFDCFDDHKWLFQKYIKMQLEELKPSIEKSMDERLWDGKYPWLTLNQVK